MMRSHLVALTAAILYAVTGSAAAENGPRFTDVASFLDAYGDHAVEVAPTVYRIDRGGGRFTEVGFGVEAIRRDLERLKQQREKAASSSNSASPLVGIAEHLRRFDDGIAELARALKGAELGNPKVSDFASAYLCNEGSASVSANAIAGLAYGEASASAQVSVFGPPNPQPPSFTGCAYSAVLLGGLGSVMYGNNNGCDSPINTLGSPRQTDTGSYGPDFCPKSAATAWVSGSGASCNGYQSYISVYVEDNPCNLP